jgi:nitrile hydratase accessory protein
LNPADALLRAAEPVAPIPRGPDGVPTFEEPWQAQAFAMTLVLHERGLFTWSEWVSTLAAEIAGANTDGEVAHHGTAVDADDYGSAYYRHWLAAIERLVVDKGAATLVHLGARRDAWDRAAHATPHGQPILLDNDPLSPGPSLRQK